LIGSAAALVFLLLAARWLLVLRRTALDATLPLTWVDKLVAAAPIGYTVLCFIAAGVLADRFTEVLDSRELAVPLPLAGTLPRAEALWLLGLLVGLAATSPVVVVFTVESYFARKLPALVELGRRAVWAMVSGVRLVETQAHGSTPGRDDDERRNRLLGL
jgi:hypothetical protein